MGFKSDVAIESGDGFDTYVFRCRMGKMGNEGKIIWVPKELAKYFGKSTYIEVRIRRLI